jgi:hypothetical protein
MNKFKDAALNIVSYYCHIILNSDLRFSQKWEFWERAKCFKGTHHLYLQLSLPPASGFLLGLLFIPVDKGDMFLTECWALSRLQGYNPEDYASSALHFIYSYTCMEVIIVYWLVLYMIKYQLVVIWKPGTSETHSESKFCFILKCLLLWIAPIDHIHSSSDSMSLNSRMSSE